MQADELRKKHPKITLNQVGHRYENGDLIFWSQFKLEPNLTFHPQVTLHQVPPERYDRLSSQTLENYALQLGLAEVFSYWKAAIPEEIAITAAELDPEQLEFWHDLLIKGMGEFFYVNQINFTRPNFVKFTNHKDLSTRLKPTPEPAKTVPLPHSASESDLSGCLIPLGGGKDSLVSLELLKQHSQESLTLFALDPTEAVKTIFALNPELPILTASRQIDPLLLELNHSGYLNGHTPFSSYLAFLTTTTAQIFGLKNVVLSNERSSNEESVIYLDHPVNHQYSKSYELEENFRNYARAYLPQPTVVYFSFLRPLYELQIAQLFTNSPQYFSVFKSCNRQQRQNRWCGECSKCLFAYLILYPFLSEATMTDIFGINLLNNVDLWSTTKELIGYSHQKPLDCVGTHEESLVALYLCYQKDQQYNKTLSKISEKFAKEVLPREQNLEARATQIFEAWNKHHALPEEFAKILKYVHQETFFSRQ